MEDGKFREGWRLLRWTRTGTQEANKWESLHWKWVERTGSERRIGLAGIQNPWSTCGRFHSDNLATFSNKRDSLRRCFEFFPFHRLIIVHVVVETSWNGPRKRIGPFVERSIDHRRPCESLFSTDHLHSFLRIVFILPSCRDALLRFTSEPL